VFKRSAQPGIGPLFRLGVAVAGLFFSGIAQAHVKWFSPYDLTQPPVFIGDIITREYLYFYVGSAFFIYAFFLFDRWAYHRKLYYDVLTQFTITEQHALIILRVSVALFFFSVAAYGWYDQPFLLTPELKTDISLVPYAQIAIGLFAFHRKTLPLIGLGIILLYIVATSFYGIFHTLDYLIFIGVAYFFLVSYKPSPGWIKSRYVVMFAATGLTLLWASVEKWGYPAWTYPLLEREPGMLMGMTPYNYMVLAGFVEFNITFILLSSASVLSRAIALGLMLVFILAIWQFGVIDAIGHAVIIAILFILVVRGPTSARELLVLPGKSTWTEAYFMTGLWFLAFNVIFLLYYGIYYFTYW
jgi:hypothetical protein